MLNKSMILEIYRRLKKSIHDAYDLNCQGLLISLILIDHVKSIQLDIFMCSKGMYHLEQVWASMYLVLYR